MHKRAPIKGFTLLEILLSLVVISFFIVVAISIMQRVQRKSSIDTVTAQMNAITNAAVVYYSMYQQWPQNLKVLGPFLPSSLAVSACSVWKNSTGCVPYQIVTPVNAHYFAVAVTPPDAGVAQQLVGNLPNAYWDQGKVVSYTSTYSRPQPTMPTGILFAATNKDMGEGCEAGSNDKYAGKSSPFNNCVPSAAPEQSYGLTDIAQQPLNFVVYGANFGSSSNYEGSVFTQASISKYACPQNAAPTMLFLPEGVWTRNTTPSGSSNVDWTSTHFASAHFITQGCTAGPITGTLVPTYWKSCAQSNIGYTTAAGTPGAGDTNNNGNFWAGFGDFLCLPTGATTNWPDGNCAPDCRGL